MSEWESGEEDCMERRKHLGSGREGAWMARKSGRLDGPAEWEAG